MSKKIILNHRIHAAFILAIAFLLVLSSNRLNKRNHATISDSVTSVYNDRILAQAYLYDLGNIFHDYELALLRSQDAEAQIQMMDTEAVNTLLSDFSATRLTAKESRSLALLKRDFEQLAKTSPSGENILSAKDAFPLLSAVNKHLDALSEIQLTEGHQLTQRSKKSLRMNTLLGNLEIGFWSLSASSSLSW